jgi:hypothetical protein
VVLFISFSYKFCTFLLKEEEKVTYDFAVGKGKSELVIEPSGTIVKHSKALKENKEKEEKEENEKEDYAYPCMKERGREPEYQ